MGYWEIEFIIHPHISHIEKRYSNVATSYKTRQNRIVVNPSEIRYAGAR